MIIKKLINLLTYIDGVVLSDDSQRSSQENTNQSGALSNTDTDRINKLVDWINSRKTTLVNQNNSYMTTIGVMLSSYIGALLVSAGWMLSSNLLTGSPNLQATQLIANYPNLAVPLLILGGVSIGYFSGFTALGYLYLQNRLQLNQLEIKYAQILKIPSGLPIVGTATHWLFSMPFAFLCIVPPLITATGVVVRWIPWTSGAPGVSRLLEFSYLFIIFWYIWSLLNFILALTELILQWRKQKQIIEDLKINEILSQKYPGA